MGGKRTTRTALDKDGGLGGVTSMQSARDAARIGALLVHRVVFPWLTKRDRCDAHRTRCRNDPFNRNFRCWYLGTPRPPCCCAHLIELLRALDRALVERDIPYFALWGMHIGAVRHGGLIPWDTDIDIGIETVHRSAVHDAVSALTRQHGYYVSGLDRDLVRLAYREWNQSHVDIELWHPDPEDPDRIAFQSEPSLHRSRRSEFFPQQRRLFHGIDLAVPNSVEYLLDYYGSTVFTYGYRKDALFRQRSFRLQDFSPARVG
jgi:hypothetical protein